MTCWQALEIAPTTDVAAIRRAYAVLLKRLDVDRDPQAFQALREARDDAIWRARNDMLEDGADDGTDWHDPGDWGLGTLDGASAPPEQPAAFEPAPEPAPTPDADDPLDTLYALLEPYDDDIARSVPDAATAATMRAAFDAVVADPRMEAIDVYDQRERWLANMLALAWPTSEPLVAPAVAHFDWDRLAGRIGNDWAVDFVIQRARAAAFECAVADRGHPNHAAWRELTRAGGGRSWRNPLLRRSTVNALLQRIRSDYPTLEDRLDPTRVALWDRSTDPAPRRSWVIVLVVIVTLNLLIRLPGCDDTPDAPPITTLARAIEASSFATSVSAADIARANPDLQLRLNTRFAADRARGLSGQALADDIDTALADHLKAVFADPPYPVLRSSAALLAARAEEARRAGADACVDLLYGSDPPRPERPVPGRLEPDVAHLRRQALLAEPARGGAPDRTIAGDVATIVRQRTGLDEAAFAAALVNRGPAAARCDARIAAIRVGLSLPQVRGEPLLRTVAQ